MSPRSDPASHPTDDLQLAVLRNLPTPVLVLSPSRTIIFANHAAERSLETVVARPASAEGIRGLSLAHLGVELVDGRRWEAVLDESTTHQVKDGDQQNAEAADVVILNSKHASRHFRVLIGTIAVGGGVHYMLSFEQAPAVEANYPTRIESLPTTASQSISALGVRSRVDRLKLSIFDSSKVVGFIMTADEKFYLSNNATREVLGPIMGGPEGCDGSSFRGNVQVWDQHFTQVLQPSEFPAIRLVRSRKPFKDVKFGFNHALTGHKAVMNVSGECLYDDSGEFLGGLCWCKDLEDYSKFVVEEQQRRLQSHETICNLMPHMVWTTQPDGEVDYFSQRWYDFTGLSAEQSLGDGFSKVVHPDDIDLLWQRWEYHRKEGNECSVEVRYRRKDGIYKWMLIRACPLRDDNGTVLKWYGTSSDIHELVMARIEAARNKLQILTVLAHAEVNLFSIDKDRKVTMAEGGMKWDTDTSVYDVRRKSTMIGRDAIELSQASQPGGVPGYEKSVKDILAGKVDSASSEDMIGERLYRTRCVAELAQNLVDGAKKPEVIGVLGLSIDVTDMKRRAALEEDNSRLIFEEQAAKDSNKLKSQFLANMSHEMRTPTAGVIGMVDLLSDDPTLTPSQRSFVNSIQLSAKALLTIVNDILDFSKIESGRLDIETVPFNLATVLSELVKMLGMFASQKGLELVYENEMDTSLELLGDPGRTRQVLSNLLTNALKFTRKGKITLIVTSEPIESGVLGDETLEVKFVVKDTGIGIEKPVLEKLFKPFIQGDASTARLYGGTGLGLTISRNLASLMAGKISLTSVPGEGSTACFIVPFKIASRIGSQVTSAPTIPPATGFSGTSPVWTEPLMHRAMSQDALDINLLNQQISSSVTAYSSSGLGIGEAPLKTLTPEERAKIHVLVVEDNAINQTIALANIKKLHFSVSAVWNGREALSYVLSNSPSKPQPDIILMDVQMPEMDGYEATRLLRNLSTSSPPVSPRGTVLVEPHDSMFSMSPEQDGVLPSKARELQDIPVIAMTASAIQGDREKCHDAGMDDYLSKPVEKGKLEDMLVKWSSRKRKRSEFGGIEYPQSST